MKPIAIQNETVAMPLDEAVRDLRAGVSTAYYRVLLDEVLIANRSFT